jgi:hypothetical protein
MDGVKLSECPPEEIAKVTAVAQEAFLTQLFDLGFFHGEYFHLKSNRISCYHHV